MNGRMQRRNWLLFVLFEMACLRQCTCCGGVMAPIA